MDVDEGKTVPRTEEQLHAGLRRPEWTKGLSDETLTAITNSAEHFTPRKSSLKSTQKSSMCTFSSRAGSRQRFTICWARSFRKIPWFEGSVLGLFFVGLSERSLLREVC
jgi:hypothetical protein